MIKLNKEQVLKLHTQLIEATGGSHGIRDEKLLDSALEGLTEAMNREIKEELGFNVDIICKIGVVSDYYNLIHRHNINHYYLCKVISSGKRNLTKEEIEDFHLSTLKLTFAEAVDEYRKCSDTKLGRLVANRELPVLNRAKELMEELVK